MIPDEQCVHPVFVFHLPYNKRWHIALSILQKCIPTISEHLVKSYYLVILKTIQKNIKYKIKIYGVYIAILVILLYNMISQDIYIQQFSKNSRKGLTQNAYAVQFVKQARHSSAHFYSKVKYYINKAICSAQRVYFLYAYRWLSVLFRR